MDQKISQEILKKINDKGWNVYFRGKQGAKIDPKETFERGPVETLESGLLYVILPKVDDPKDQEQTNAFIEKHQVQPKIIAPTGFNYPVLSGSNRLRRSPPRNKFCRQNLNVVGAFKSTQ